MPRPGPARKPYAVRFAGGDMAEIEKEAQREGLTRSQMIRGLCTEALAARRERSSNREHRIADEWRDGLDGNPG